MIQAQKYIRANLSEFYSEEEIRNFSLLIIEKLTGFSRTKILTDKNNVLSAEQNEKLKTIVERLRTNEPLQYILGETEFYSLPMEVNPQTLIPRPETEELVDLVLQLTPKDAGIRILDIGTGSGCIAIALAKNLPCAKVTAVDISDEALALAKQNAARNQVAIDFLPVNILDEQSRKKMLVSSNEHVRFDIIISNPPYICEKEKVDMAPNVLEYEPHSALFVPDSDPLLFYREIGYFAFENLISNGKLFFEINQQYGNKTLTLLKAMGFKESQLIKDLSGNDRIISCTR